jgi:hypothetical protein
MDVPGAAASHTAAFSTASPSFAHVFAIGVVRSMVGFGSAPTSAPVGYGSGSLTGFDAAILETGASVSRYGSRSASKYEYLSQMSESISRA